MVTGRVKLVNAKNVSWSSRRPVKPTAVPIPGSSSRRSNVPSSWKIFKLDGTFERRLELPGIGTAVGFTGRREDQETFFAFTSFTRPVTIYRHDFKLGRSLPFHRTELAFDPGRYVTRQVRCTSKDGTPIPLFLTYKNGLVKDGRTPTLLYGFFGAMIIGQAVMLTVAALALWDARKTALLPWVLTLMLYWPLGALAAYRAVFELFYAPFLWHKTEHGFTEAPAPHQSA